VTVKRENSRSREIPSKKNRPASKISKIKIIKNHAGRKILEAGYGVRVLVAWLWKLAMECVSL
jgi:hypothetical protein